MRYLIYGFTFVMFFGLVIYIKFVSNEIHHTFKEQATAILNQHCHSGINHKHHHNKLLLS
ncbi:hypothetical protein GCM10011328_15340 [Hafnia psychrotolerans]|uniref:Uncharacterized protein n=1 Tax=Hafnia psychrotolerans TaxID=1477018 RepID=A0ABQ1GD41_9GAMM|nr:hypothetical protein GCM10011328_15340 [Hafnia psychrotolerans]